MIRFLAGSLLALVACTLCGGDMGEDLKQQAAKERIQHEMVLRVYASAAKYLEKKLSTEEAAKMSAAWKDRLETCLKDDPDADEEKVTLRVLQTWCEDRAKLLKNNPEKIKDEDLKRMCWLCVRCYSQQYRLPQRVLDALQVSVVEQVEKHLAMRAQ